jgi:hypothetical protein
MSDDLHLTAVEAQTMIHFRLERTTGFEPATLTLAR